MSKGLTKIVIACAIGYTAGALGANFVKGGTLNTPGTFSPNAWNVGGALAAALLTWRTGYIVKVG